MIRVLCVLNLKMVDASVYHRKAFRILQIAYRNEQILYNRVHMVSFKHKYCTQINRQTDNVILPLPAALRRPLFPRSLLSPITSGFLSHLDVLGLTLYGRLPLRGLYGDCVFPGWQCPSSKACVGPGCSYPPRSMGAGPVRTGALVTLGAGFPLIPFVTWERKILLRTQGRLTTLSTARDGVQVLG